MSAMFEEILASDLIGFAKAYAGLGWSVQAQLEQMIDEGDACFDGLNPNAVDLIVERLEGYSEEIDEICYEYQAWLEDEADKNEFEFDCGDEVTA